jgi:hypothetical protein
VNPGWLSPASAGRGADRNLFRGAGVGGGFTGHARRGGKGLASLVQWEMHRLDVARPMPDSSDPFADVLIGSDDFPTIGRSGFNFDLVAGAPYVLVMTGFANDEAGAFENTIEGPGNIRLGSNARVPEAGSVVPLFGLVLVGFGLARRRWSRSTPVLA